jgi:hypothetical protein
VAKDALTNVGQEILAKIGAMDRNTKQAFNLLLKIGTHFFSFFTVQKHYSIFCFRKI